MSHPNRTSWFVTLPIAATAIGFLWLIFFPTARAIREKRNEIRVKQDFVLQSRNLTSVVDQLERELAEAEQFAEEWQQTAPASGQLSRLYGAIHDRIRQSGIMPTRFEPQQETLLEAISRAAVQVEVAGTFADLRLLLASLERLPEVIWVEDLKIEKQSEDGQSVKCELKLEIFAGSSKKSG